MLGGLCWTTSSAHWFPLTSLTASLSQGVSWGEWPSAGIAWAAPQWGSTGHERPSRSLRCPAKIQSDPNGIVWHAVNMCKNMGNITVLGSYSTPSLKYIETTVQQIYTNLASRNGLERVSCLGLDHSDPFSRSMKVIRPRLFSQDKGGLPSINQGGLTSTNIGSKRNNIRRWSSPPPRLTIPLSIWEKQTQPISKKLGNDMSNQTRTHYTKHWSQYRVNNSKHPHLYKNTPFLAPT